MSGNPVEGIGKRIKGYAKEVVAEVTGDARLQEDGRREIAEGRVQGSGPASDPRLHEAPGEPRR